MKVGIITFWESDDNYGQVLQCWALQQCLKRMGHEPFLIRYKRYNPAPHLPFSYRIKQKIKGLIKVLLIYPAFKSYKRKRAILQEQLYYKNRNALRSFTDFREKNIDSTEFIYNNYEELEKHPPKADAYITGSDQVWFYMDNLPNMQAYFLQFGDKNIKRISYAPSIGSISFPEEKKQRLKDYLSTFNAISVREKSSMAIVEEAGYQVSQVVDPTLLLSARDYISTFPGKKDRQPYIFIYSLNYFSNEDIAWDCIKNYAVQHGLKIVVTPSSGYLPTKELFEGVEYEYATICEWLNNIKNAQLVITPSYHGIIFSILFHKKFIFTPLKGWMEKSNNRVTDLLDDMVLQQQIWYDQKTIDEYMSMAVNWEDVDKAIETKRVKSAFYLQNSLIS